MIMNRNQYADIILQRLIDQKEEISQQYNSSKDKIGYFWVDDLLPEELALEINQAFAQEKEMVLKKSLKEDQIYCSSNESISSYFRGNYFTLFKMRES